MYEDFIEKNNLIFSDNYDLTKTFNENIITNSEINKENQEDEHENDILKITKRIEIEMDNKKKEIDFEFIKPIINGFVEIRSIKEYEKDFIFCVIARKDNRRTGMRYLCRGADLNGNCANFIETETLIFINDLKENDYNKNNYIDVISHLQIRGSIPLLWSQPSNFNFVPKVNKFFQKI